MTEEKTIDAPPVEQQLPGTELPEYHGRRPSGMKSSITGSANRITRAHDENEVIVAVVELRLKGAGHDFTEKNGLVYTEKLRMRDLFEVPGAAGKRLLAAMRSSYQVADDRRNGKAALEGDDGLDLVAAGVTDASGVVLTATELAELRGDPVRAALDERLDPVVVIFSDGSRELWPDEFDPDEVRPHAGDRYEDDGDETGGPASWIYVAEVLHHATGERLEVWTEEQENERLRALEEQLAAEEADADPVERLRLTFPDGSTAERPVGASDDGVHGTAEDVARAETVVAVRRSGAEEVMKARAGDVSVSTIVEDADGFADVVQFPRNPDDVQLLDGTAMSVKNRIRDLTDRDRLGRLKAIEETAKKPRKGVLDAIEKRLAVLPVPVEPPVEPVSFDAGLESLEPPLGDDEEE